MTRLAKDIMHNLIGTVLDTSMAQTELNQMEHDYGEGGEEAVQMVEKYLQDIQNKMW